MTPISRINQAAAHIRAMVARPNYGGIPYNPVFIAEDPDKFGPGQVVIEDGKTQRMMITKIVVGFAQCIWFSDETFDDDGDMFVYKLPHFEIVHTNVLTLSPDQSWKP